MFFKQNPMDHLADDPIIRCDIAARVLKAAESDGNLPIAWRVFRLPQAAERPCQTRASLGPMHVAQKPLVLTQGLTRGCAAVCDNLHKKQKLKARRMNPFKSDAL
ncbi:hypothetical protein [Mesorhizobium ventifaucium]|uniref:Uncharacterized protein n=1 Tax=Mesorhizobium ventifaucium TaxID=666020 RepID=A0ABM9DZ48_9HYPH|nr:hypothetical protein [Mesorhizobium ventifaucium]CAH2402047.1 hypothetical protein MES4922_30421 [Mesorhizobium ventifaucium]